METTKKRRPTSAERKLTIATEALLVIARTDTSNMDSSQFVAVMNARDTAREALDKLKIDWR